MQRFAEEQKEGVIRRKLEFVRLIYPYFLYHLLFFANWFTWTKVPVEVNIYATIIILILCEFILACALKDSATANVKRSFLKRGILFLINVFFLVLPLLIVLGFLKSQHPGWLWVRWIMAFNYINHESLLDYGVFKMSLLGIGSIAIGCIFYLFISKRPRVLWGLYLPWIVFMSPLFIRYGIGGVFKGDISRYDYIEYVVNPLERVGTSISTPPAPRGLYIEKDTAYTAYQTTLLASSVEGKLLRYKLDSKQMDTINISGIGIRRLFSRETDPYLYIVVWKWDPGLFRIKKDDKAKPECLLGLSGAPFATKKAQERYKRECRLDLDNKVHLRAVKGLDKIYQISNLYVDTKKEAVYLLSEIYPALIKYPLLQDKSIKLLDLNEAGYCPIGSMINFAPAIDPDEQYLYFAPTNCFCGVVKVDMNELNVAGCYKVKSPRHGFYGVVYYKAGLLYCFPVIKYYKTAILDSKNMKLLREVEKPPFHFIRDVLELDDENLLCLGFFGDLAIFNMRTGKYTTLVRKDLSLAMGLFKYGDYIYFNTAQHGILRIKIGELLKRASSH